VLVYRIWFDQVGELQLQPDTAPSAWTGAPGDRHPGQLVLTFRADGVLDRAVILYRVPLDEQGRALR